MGGVIKLNDNAFPLLLGDCPAHANDNGDCRQLNMLEILEGYA
jgi:hypothetical protein